ncbi:hypothetical protein NVP1060A_53 [Vibrio phage 1.060.A._10N.261.48.B5]|nr:hypothetical protein NVP1060A_53 [Vibrio phage 1.060.A._10N.261.48.B5]
MNTLESKLRIAHQIQVAAANKGLTCNIDCTVISGNLYPSIWVHTDVIVEHLELYGDATEQELLDWWEEIAK